MRTTTSRLSSDGTTATTSPATSTGGAGRASTRAPEREAYVGADSGLRGRQRAHGVGDRGVDRAPAARRQLLARQQLGQRPGHVARAAGGRVVAGVGHEVRRDRRGEGCREHLVERPGRRDEAELLTPLPQLGGQRGRLGHRQVGVVADHHHDRPVARLVGPRVADPDPRVEDPLERLDLRHAGVQARCRLLAGAGHLAGQQDRHRHPGLRRAAAPRRQREPVDEVAGGPLLRLLPVDVRRGAVGRQQVERLGEGARHVAVEVHPAADQAVRPHHRAHGDREVALHVVEADDARGSVDVEHHAVEGRLGHGRDEPGEDLGLEQDVVVGRDGAARDAARLEDAEPPRAVCQGAAGPPELPRVEDLATAPRSQHRRRREGGGERRRLEADAADGHARKVRKDDVGGHFWMVSGASGRPLGRSVGRLFTDRWSATGDVGRFVGRVGPATGASSSRLTPAEFVIQRRFPLRALPACKSERRVTALDAEPSM